MPTCDACEKLRDARPEVPPHEALKLVGGNAHQLAYSKKKYEVYQCTVCGTPWGRDLVYEEPGDGWYMRFA